MLWPGSRAGSFPISVLFQTYLIMAHLHKIVPEIIPAKDYIMSVVLISIGIIPWRGLNTRILLATGAIVA